MWVWAPRNRELSTRARTAERQCQQRPWLPSNHLRHATKVAWACPRQEAAWSTGARCERLWCCVPGRRRRARRQFYAALGRGECAQYQLWHVFTIAIIFLIFEFEFSVIQAGERWRVFAFWGRCACDGGRVEWSSARQRPDTRHVRDLARNPSFYPARSACFTSLPQAKCDVDEGSARPEWTLYHWENVIIWDGSEMASGSWYSWGWRE